MNVKQIEHIVTACREGSFSEAARKLGISQPSLSKSIGRFEEEFSISLFERTATGIQPSSEAMQIAERGEEILELINGLSLEISRWSRGEAGHLRIGVGGVTKLHPLPAILTFTIETFPQLTIEVVQHKGAPLARAVQSGQVDLAFSYSRNAEGFGDLMRIKLFEDDQIVVVRPGHPALERGVLGPRDLAQYPHASFGDLKTFREAIGEVSHEELRRICAFASDDVDQICAYVRASDAIARAPRFCFKPFLADGRVVELPSTGLHRYECWLLTTAGKWRSPIVKSVAGFARALGDPR